MVHQLTVDAGSHGQLVTICCKWRVLMISMDDEILRMDPHHLPIATLQTKILKFPNNYVPTLLVVLLPLAVKFGISRL